MFQYLLDEVPGIDGQVWGQIEFTLQDLINGLLPVFSCEWRLVENRRRESVVTKLLTSCFTLIWAGNLEELTVLHTMLLLSIKMWSALLGPYATLLYVFNPVSSHDVSYYTNHKRKKTSSFPDLLDKRGCWCESFTGGNSLTEFKFMSKRLLSTFFLLSYSLTLYKILAFGAFCSPCCMCCSLVQFIE